MRSDDADEGHVVYERRARTPESGKRCDRWWSDRRSRTRLLAALPIAIGLCLASCTISSWSHERDARARLRACEAENPSEPEACAGHRQAARDAYEQYEEDAEDLWLCDDSDPCSPLDDD